MGDEARAVEDWSASAELSEAALRVNPRDVVELRNLATCRAKLGAEDEARRLAQKALEVGPESWEAFYAAAVVHALVGDAPRALAFLEKAFGLGASVSEAEWDDDLASLRETQEFEKIVEQAASTHPRR